MSADFNWWLLLVGMVVGGALTWLVLADSGRRDRDIEDVETAAEASWITRSLDRRVDPDTVERVLRAHRRYLGFPPPDAFVDPEALGIVDAGDARGGAEVPEAGSGEPDEAADEATVPPQPGSEKSA